jgi:hypothetical protein
MNMITRRIPIDAQDLYKQTGIRKGKVCYSYAFGWVVQNEGDAAGPHAVTIDPPPMEDGEVFVFIKDNQWCFDTEARD